MRNLARSVCDLRPAKGAVHSLAAVREGVLAGTASGAYAMAFAPDGAIRPLPVAAPPLGSAAAAPRCVGVCAAPIAHAESVIVTSFQWPSAGTVSHSVGVLRGVESPLGAGWRQVSTLCGAAHRASVQGRALRVPGNDGVTLFVGADDVSGAVQLWEASEGGGGAPLTCLGGAGLQQARLLHVDAAVTSPQRWGIATVRAPGQGSAQTSGPQLTLTSVAIGGATLR